MDLVGHLLHNCATNVTVCERDMHLLVWYNALSVSCILSFSVFSNQAHSLWFPQVGQETAPLGVSGCCHATSKFGLRVLTWILWGICYTIVPQM